MTHHPDLHPPLPAQRSESGLGIAALVLGVVAFATVWIPIVGFTSWFTAPLGLIVGLIGLARHGSKALAIAGSALSLLALVGCFMWLSATGATVQIQ